MRETSPRINRGYQAPVLHYHELKTACMQKKLPGPALCPGGNQDAMNSSQATGWLGSMRVIQIYG